MAVRPLDRIDIEILEELQKNARISNKDLAARVHLAPSSCLERVRGLQERGAFRATLRIEDVVPVGTDADARGVAA